MTQTQQTTTHTATPICEGDGMQIYIHGILAAELVRTGAEEENGPFIVTACNQHAALVSEAKALREALEELVNSPNAKQNACWDRARRALSLSQVKP